jgi:hypothetical protein
MIGRQERKSRTFEVLLLGCEGDEEDSRFDVGIHFSGKGLEIPLFEWALRFDDKNPLLRRSSWAIMVFLSFVSD